MRFLIVAILGLTLTGCGGQATKARLDPTGPWEWTFDSSIEPGKSVVFSLVLAEHNDTLGPQAGTSVTVTPDNVGTQCTNPPSFAATVGPNNSVKGTAVSC